ncbi:MAG TPA: hypothetical protein PLB50_09145 [Candidatus Saccharicenans sp.]|nr:hypothetical protein [Candidatus Saccharicenans sp.]
MTDLLYTIPMGFIVISARPSLLDKKITGSFFEAKQPGIVTQPGE